MGSKIREPGWTKIRIQDKQTSRISNTGFYYALKIVSVTLFRGPKAALLTKEKEIAVYIFE
jgi:hypothetical protein